MSIFDIFLFRLISCYFFFFSLISETVDWCDESGDLENDNASFLTALDDVEKSLRNEIITCPVTHADVPSKLSAASCRTSTDIGSDTIRDSPEKTEKLDETVWGESDEESLFQSIDSDAVLNRPGTAAADSTFSQAKKVPTGKSTLQFSDTNQKRRFKYESSDEEESVNSTVKRITPKKTKIDAILNTASRKKFVKSKRVYI